VGWALGDGFEHGDDPFWDAKEADQLYNILEQEVIPEFYNRNEKGIPTAWISRMRESMALLTPQFSADRSIREYTEQHYMPAAKAYMERTANKGKLAVQIRDQLKTLNEKWDTLHFGEVNVTINDNQYNFKIQVYLNNLDPETVQVEIYANAVNGQDTFIQKMTCSVKPEGISNSFYYETSVTSTRPVTDFTARIIPCIPDIEIPLENTKILWQK
jgi:starch phosphorylase